MNALFKQLLGGKKKHKKKRGVHKAGDAVEDVTGCLGDGCCLGSLIGLLTAGLGLIAGARLLKSPKN